MNILLLNLTRFGDLLQSQAAIKDLAAQGHSVAVVCLENFAQAASLLAGVSHVFSLPGATLLERLFRTQTAYEGAGVSALFTEAPEAHAGSRASQGWLLALAELSAWRKSLYASFCPDAVCNLTPSLSARMLAFFLAQGRPCMGFAVDSHGFGCNSNAWAAFLQGAGVARGVSPFNVVDLFRMIAQLPNKEKKKGAGLGLVGDAGLVRISAAESLAAKDFLSARSPENCKGFVALQLGASEDRRRWPVASFAALGDILWQEEKLCPVLLGSKAEKKLTERYASICAHPHIDACGETNLRELAGLLSRTRLLVSNDTGTMHLAAGLGVPVLAIFLATAQPFDTGPYSADSCCVEPALPCHPCEFGRVCRHEEACRRHVGPEYMAALARSRLHQGTWTLEKNKNQEDCARLWLCAPDDTGFMSLRPAYDQGQDARTAWLMLQRHYLRLYLERDPKEEFLPAPRSDLALLPEPERRIFARQMGQAAELAELMLQQGRVLLTHPVPLMRERFLATWQKMHDHLRQNSGCAALALLWVQETQAEGQDLPVVLAMTGQFAALLRAIERQLIEYADEKRSIHPDGIIFANSLQNDMRPPQEQ